MDSKRGRDKKMLIKFENKSNRVKGLTFHPRRPWILASLHDGSLQLWDYRMEVMIDKFEEHEGPVRGVCFHSTQPLFVSGGDDYKVKVWNYQLKRCLFNLIGHLDYIRSVEFHKEYPWVLSASDDQTLRIWNWQSRSCISVLTGHNHYVMSASFHPREDLILSASLDQTVRVWDYSELRKKSVSIAVPDFSSGPGGNSAGSDLFGGTDVVVRHVMEGHSRGVNWASFHPTLSLIASGADDREVKLWRMNDAKAWEVDTMRGHVNNVSCVIFHPKRELILSNSEDKTIRVWDISKQNPPKVLRRDSDRYWILEAHPKLNLLAAGHDTGMVVFKLSRERPPMDADSQFVFYYKDNYVYESNFKTGKERPVLSTRRRTSGSSAPPTKLYYNTANRSHHCVLLCTEGDYSYELFTFSKQSDGSRDDGMQALRGFGKSAVFVSRNRFAVLDKSRQIWLKNLKNETKRKLRVGSAVVHQLFPGGTGRLLLRTAEHIILYDIQALKVVSELSTQSRHPIKYVSWSQNNKMVAMFSKASIYIASSKLEELCLITENTRIKSGAWDKCGVFVYTTSTHIKYVLPNGDRGIVRTLPVPLYITSVTTNTITYIDREHACGKLVIDSTEYLFKVALWKRRNKEVLRLMQSRKLVGQSIISFLQSKGYPEVALHFVEDAETKFALALECGNIAVALECASALNTPECWHKLGVEALRQGNHQVVEAAYQKTKNFERLSFLYLITGNTNKLAKMLHISKLRNDLMGRFHNALYLGDVAERVAVLREANQPGLAYLAAKAHGLESEMEELAQELGERVPQDETHRARLFMPPTPILRAVNWPLLEVGKGFFEQVGQEVPSDEEEEDGKLEEAGSDEDMDLGGGWGDSAEGVGADAGGAGWGDDLDLGDLAGDKKVSGGGEGGWGDDLDMPDLGEFGGEELEAADEGVVLPLPGKAPPQRWAGSSACAGDLVASGAFDLAMHALHRQVGVVNFEPLKPLFMQLHLTTFVSTPSPPPCSSLFSYLSRDESSPLLSLTLSMAVEDLKFAYKAVTDGKFAPALARFRLLLQSLSLLVVNSKSEQQEVLELRDICREYITALRLELARKESSDPVRQAQLAAYFTTCKLQPLHTALGLRVAIKCNYSVRNLKTTAIQCRRVLELAVSANNAQISSISKLPQVKGVLKICERDGMQDKHDINFDESTGFLIDCRALQAIDRKDALKCPFCLSAFGPKLNKSLCDTCNLSRIGSEVLAFLPPRQSVP